MAIAKNTLVLAAVAGVGIGCAALPRATAQDTAAEPPVRQAVESDRAQAPPDRQAREERFKTLLTGVRLVGRFTIDGPPGGEGGDRRPPNDEEYVIRSVAKLGDGDWWTVVARMRYGTVDLTLPVPVEVKWAGDTPVITLDKVAVPGLGTFSSRVVIDGARYAGTWQHDAVGGHMFGRILPLTEPQVPPDSEGKAPRP